MSDDTENASEKAESKRLMRGGVDPAVGKATQIKPGEVRNPGGRPKNTPITDIYAKILESSENREVIEEMVLRMFRKGQMGAVLQLKEMAERVEGKVTQPIEGDLNFTLSERLLSAKARKITE